MPISTEASTGSYKPVPVPEQNYHRMPSRKFQTNVNELQNIPAINVETKFVSIFRSSSIWLKLVLVVLILITICAAAIVPAVLLTQIFTTTTMTTATATVPNSNSSSTIVITTVSLTTLATTTGVTTTTVSTSSTSLFPTNVCTYWTSYTMIATGYYGTERIDINCTQTLSNFTAIINVLRTVGATYGNQYSTFWGGTMQQSYSTSSSQIQYIWKIVSGQTISNNGFPYYFEAQFQLQGTNQTVSNDTFSITARSTCNGQLLTFSGHF